MALLTPQIGLTEDAHAQLIVMLNARLADTFVLYTKLHNFHWNVTGPQFLMLHQLFETQYDQLHDALDEIAERVRQLGGVALGSLAEFVAATTLSEAPGKHTDAETMIQTLLVDHEAVARQLRQDAEIAAALADAGTNDFLIGLLQAHEKMAWFLRAHLEA